MTQVKICPECNAEYFVHIVECADCGVLLKSPEAPEELEAVRERQRRFEEEEIQNGVTIKEGEKDLVFELHHVLLKKGYSCRVVPSPDATPGKCGEKFILIVPKKEAPSATQCLKEHSHEMYPELKQSEELAAQGRCPACGFDIGADARECPDCGLLLLIEGQEECGDDGCLH